MAGDREEEIRKRAHEKWVQAGKPEGEHLNHWHSASAEVHAEQSAPSAQQATDAGPASATHMKDAEMPMKTGRKPVAAKPKKI